MRLMILLAVVSSLLVSCSGVPEKPSVYLCSVDIPRQQLICSPTGDVKSMDQASYEEISRYIVANSKRVKIPISQSDKFIAFPPGHWEQVASYMKILRDIAERRCR